MAVERRQLFLGGAAGLVVIVAVVMMWPATPAPVAPAAGAGGARVRETRASRAAAAAKASPGEVGPVRLGALKGTTGQPGEAQRNPFRFQPRVVPPPPRPVETTPVIEAPRPPPVPTGPPPAPPIPLKLIGVVERENGVKWAVLSDGKSVHHGKDGDIIDGRYTIVKIGAESIEMTHADGRGRQVIRLTGQ